jgi:hypothetical protein
LEHPVQGVQFGTQVVNIIGKTFNNFSFQRQYLIVFHSHKNSYNMKENTDLKPRH